MRKSNIVSKTGGGASLSKWGQYFYLFKYSSLKQKNKSAFTLAEVLITLGIIGIVAALLLPMIIENIERKRNAVILRRAYSDLGNYIQMYAVDNGCISLLSECPERSGDFSRSFALYLKEKQKFQEMHHCTSEQNWQISYFTNSQGGWSRTPYYGCTTISASSSAFYLRSPSAYAYFIEPFPYDMYYHTKNKNNFFRLKITIFTDQNRMGYITRWGEDSGGSKRKYPQEGRNMFTVFVMDSKAIIPQGSPECGVGDSWAYYCTPLTESNCSYKDGNFQNCMMQVINDGWEIKYKY